MILDDVPLTAAPLPDARPSPVVACIQRFRPSRRTMLKGLVVSASAAALAPLDWLLSRRFAAAGPTSEFGGCAPVSYAEQSSNWWRDDSPGAICFGGWRRGGFPCSDGFHREGLFESRGETYTATRMTATCEGRNAWRWDGYRCSDALTETVFDDGDTYKGITISACLLGVDEPAAEPGEPTPSDRDRGRRGSEPTESAGDEPDEPAGEGPTEPTAETAERAPSRTEPPRGRPAPGDDEGVPGPGSLSGR